MWGIKIVVIESDPKGVWQPSVLISRFVSGIVQNSVECQVDEVVSTGVCRASSVWQFSQLVKQFVIIHAFRATC
jgi:hypothetical protein